MTVGEVQSACHCADLRPFLAFDAQAEQSADQCAERGRLLPIEVARSHHQHTARRVFPDHDQVDQAYDTGVLEPVELREDFTTEAIAVEGKRPDLDRTVRGRSL